MTAEPIVEVAVAHELWSLSVAYAAGVDRRDRDLLLSAFDPGGVLTVIRPHATTPPRPLNGHDEIGRIFERLALFERTFHFLGQSSYAATEQGATGEIACIAHHRWTDATGRELDHVMYIRYADDYHQTPDARWVIADRTVGVEWTETRVLDVPGSTPR